MLTHSHPLAEVVLQHNETTVAPSPLQYMHACCSYFIVMTNYDYHVMMMTNYDYHLMMMINYDDMYMHIATIVIIITLNN